MSCVPDPEQLILTRIVSSESVMMGRKFLLPWVEGGVIHNDGLS
jgi:hypothetical protein